MKHFKFFALISLILFSDVAFSQTILKRAKKYVVIDIDQAFGLNLNDKVNVHRKQMSGDVQDVGILKIIFFKNGKSIGEIISEDPEYPIKIGDFISIQNDFQTKNPEYSSAQNPSSSDSNFLTYISIGAGVIASGLGYYFYDQANQTYEDYETATTSADATDLYDKTINLDNKSKIGFAVGGGLFAIGVFSYLLKQGKAPVKQDNRFSLKPVQKQDFVGLGMRFCFNHPSKK